MSDQGLMMSGPMVRAMLAGRKTMTRRFPRHWLRYHTEKPGHTKRFTKATWEAAMKERSPFTTIDLDGSGRRMAFRWTSAPLPGQDPRAEALWIAEPTCQPGEALWIRERFGSCEVADQGIGNYFIIYDEEWSRRYQDRGAGEPRPRVLRPSSIKPGLHPSIHMPRWASRLTLAVKAVKLEPIQSISSADAIAEGVPAGANGLTIDSDTPDPREGFRELWNSLHGAASWDANPVVIAFSGTVHQANIDKIVKAAA